MRYRAFLSYSRADDKTANWLHRQLDSYRTPKSLSGGGGALGPVPDKLHPIFRDRTDMSGGGELSARIEEALRESEALIVLCGPAAASSQWVNREVEVFISLGRATRILPVIAAGLPDSDNVERDFFPPALRGRGLLAADLREIRGPNERLIGDGKEVGRLKLISGLLGVPLDSLVQRERRRQRMTNALVSGAALAFAGIAVVAGWFAYTASVARDSAYAELARGFVAKAWNAIEDGNHLLAAKYALAGLESAPRFEAEFRAVLARLAFDLQDAEYWSTADRPAYSVLMSEDGAYVAAQFRDACEVRNADTWALTARIESCRFEPGEPHYYLQDILHQDGRVLVRLRGVGMAAPYSAAAAAEESRQVWDGLSGEMLTLTDWPQVHNLPEGGANWRLGETTFYVVAPGSRYSPGDSFRIWNAENRSFVFQGVGALRDACVDPTRNILVTIVGNRVQSWNLQTSARLGNFVADAWDFTEHCDIAYDDELRRWHVPSGQQLPAFDYDGGDDPELYITDDGLFSIVLDDDPYRVGDPSEETLYAYAPIVRATANGAAVGRLYGHTARFETVTFPAGGILSQDATNVTIYRRAFVAPYQFREFLGGFHHTVANDGQDLIFAAASGNTWRPEVNRSLVNRLRVSPNGPQVLAPLADPDGAHLYHAALSENSVLMAAGTNAGSVRIWDNRSGALLSTLRGHEGNVELVAFIENERVVSADSAGRVFVTDARSGERRTTIQVERGRRGRGPLSATGEAWRDDNQNNLSVTRDGRVLATVLDDDTISIWDGATSRALRTLNDDARVNAIDLANDGRLLVSGNDNGAIRVWDTESGETVATFVVRRAPISAVDISPSGRLIAAGGYDGSVRIFDRGSGHLLATLDNMNGQIMGLSFTLDGQALFAIDDQNLIAVRVLPGLDQDLDSLRGSVCRMLRDTAARRFSTADLAADTAINEIWLRGRSAERTLCADVPPARAAAERDASR